MPMGQVRIVETLERSTFDERGTPTAQIRVAWKYGERHGPFYEYMPKEGWSRAAFEQRIAAHVRELEQLEGA